MQCLLLWCCYVTFRFNPIDLEKLERPELAKPEGMWFLCPLSSGQLHAYPAAYLRDTPDDAGKVQPSIERELVPSISENGALFQCSWSSWQMCIPTQFGTFCWRIGCPNYWKGCLSSTSSWGVSKKFGPALWYGNLPCSGHWQISSEVSQFHLIIDLHLEHPEVGWSMASWLWLPKVQMPSGHKRKLRRGRYWDGQIR